MAEHSTNLYIGHSDPDILQRLEPIIQLFKNQGVDSETIQSNFISESKYFDGNHGSELAIKLFEDVKSAYGDASVDLDAHITTVAGYHKLHFVHGSSGVEVVEAIISFLGNLIPNVDARANLQGDDDPWEVFYRFEQAGVTSKHYEPLQEQRANDALPEVYVWWHSGLPGEISEGFINQWKAISDDDWEDVFG